MKYIFIVILVLNICNSSIASDTIPNQNFLKRNNINLENISIKAEFYKGFIMDHRHTMAFTINKFIPALDFMILRKQFGYRNWNYYYNFPITGIGFYYADLHNKEILGNVKALYSAVYLPLISRQNFVLSFKVSLGLAVVNKYFDIDNNIYNLLISTKYNGFYQFKFDANAFPEKRLSFNFGLGITHLSNGCTKIPNLGLNLMLANAGISYKLAPEQKIHNFYKTCNHRYSNNLVMVSLGKREVDVPSGQKYYTSSLVYAFETNLDNIQLLRIGCDLFYDQSAKYGFIKNNIEYKKNIDFIYNGLTIGYGLQFGKMVLVVDNGFYTFSKPKQQGFVYQRIGLRYNLSRHCFANLTFKTYFAMAEFIELGIGYRWISRFNIL